MSNLHIPWISGHHKIYGKTVTYVKWPMVYFLCFKFELILSLNKLKLAIYSFLLFIVTAAILDDGRDHRTQILLSTTEGTSTPNLVQISLVVLSEKIFKESG